MVYTTLCKPILNLGRNNQRTCEVENGLEAQSKTADFERVFDLDTLVEFPNSNPVLVCEVRIVVDTHSWYLIK